MGIVKKMYSNLIKLVFLQKWCPEKRSRDEQFRGSIGTLESNHFHPADAFFGLSLFRFARRPARPVTKTARPAYASAPQTYEASFGRHFMDGCQFPSVSQGTVTWQTGFAVVPQFLVSIISFFQCTIVMMIRISYYCFWDRLKPPIGRNWEVQ